MDFFSAQHDLVDLGVLFLNAANATVSSKSGKTTYQLHLLSVLFFGDLGRALLVLVRSSDALLKFLKLAALGANTLHFLALAFVLDLEFGHLASKGVLDLGRLRRHELRLKRHYINYL